MNMKTTKLFFAAMIAAVCMLTSCNQPEPTPRVYYNDPICHFVNASSCYAILTCDGDTLGGLMPTEKWTKYNFGTKFSYELQVDLHKVYDDKHYYKDIEATYTKRQQFEYNKEYKVTIKDDGVTIQSSAQ